MAAGGGGAWKVAYADFVTAMMAFFLVMWIVAQGAQVREAITEYFNDPYGKKSKTPSAIVGGYRQGRGDSMSVKQPPGGPRAGNRGSPDNDKKSKPGKVSAVRDPSLFILHDGDRRSIGTVLEFPEDSAQLTEAGTTEVKRIALALRGKPNKIEVRGHTTRRPLPEGCPFATPWDLCYARCQATMKALLAQGIEPERIRISQAAAYEPVTISDEPEKQTQNSRVDIHMLNEFVEDLVGTREERAKRFQKPETPDAPAGEATVTTPVEPKPAEAAAPHP
jgi:chemotaxis protein MotB